MSPRLVVVRWRDAHMVREEAPLAESLSLHRSAVYWSGGVLVASDAAGVTLAQDYGLPLDEGGEATFRTRTFILRELVEAEFDAGSVFRKSVRRKPQVLDQPDAGSDVPGGGANP